MKLPAFADLVPGAYYVLLRPLALTLSNDLGIVLQKHTVVVIVNTVSPDIVLITATQTPNTVEGTVNYVALQAAVDDTSKTYKLTTPLRVYYNERKDLYTTLPVGTAIQFHDTSDDLVALILADAPSPVFGYLAEWNALQQSISGNNTKVFAAAVEKR